MEPALVISLSAAAGMAVGFFGGRRSRAPEIEEVVEPSPDPQVAELSQENAGLRKLAGLSDVEPLRTKPAWLGSLRDHLQDRLADIVAQRTVRSAGFYHGDGLLIAGEPDDRVARLIAGVRPPVHWRRMQVLDERGETLALESFWGRRSEVVLAVRAMGGLPDASLSRVRYAFEGMPEVRAVLDRPVSAADAQMRVLRQMADSGQFLGLMVVDGAGERRDAVGLRFPRGTGALYGALKRYEKMVDAAATVSLSWETDEGLRYAMHPFGLADSEGVLFTVTDANTLYPHEQVRRRALQVARELLNEGGTDGD